MNGWVAILGTAAGLLGTCVVRDLMHMMVGKEVAFGKAQELSGGKGIINLGAGPHRTYQAQILAESPEILANIDAAPNGMPHFIQLDMETDRLPFADKQFGCAFASHVLEHLDSWQFALEEMVRVADYVVVVLPDPIYFSGWLAPGHRQHFSRDEIAAMAQLHPNVVVYY